MRYKRDWWLMDEESRLMVKQTIAALERAERLSRMPAAVRDAELVRTAKQGGG